MLTEPRAELAPDGAVGPVLFVLVRAEVVEDEEADRLLERGLRAEEDEATIELVEHAGPHLGVTEEVHLAVRADRAGLHLSDVVEERGPADLEARGGLADDLLGVLPDVLVPPLAVAEADHGVHLGEEGGERAVEEHRVQPEPWDRLP